MLEETVIIVLKNINQTFLTLINQILINIPTTVHHNLTPKPSKPTVIKTLRHLITLIKLLIDQKKTIINIKATSIVTGQLVKAQ